MPETLNIDTVELVSTLRKLPFRGAPSSADYNDSLNEVLIDLASIVDKVDNVLLPLVNALPAAALLPVEAPVGMEGRTLYCDSSDNTELFYDPSTSRYLTVAESMRLLRAIVHATRTKVDDLGVQVAALHTQLASDNKNDTAIALQNLTNTMAAMNRQIADLQQRVTVLGV